MPPKPHFLLLLVLFFFGFHCYAQNDLLDYVVKDNDTLYGAIRANGTNKRLWFYQRIKRDNGSTFIKEEKLKKKNLTVQAYYILYNLYNKVQMNRGAQQIIKEKYKSLSVYITDNCEVNEEGEKLIKSMETFFKPLKQLKT